jgi:5-methyltetrahydrofolate--homocysteine methyltransferase
MAIDFSPERWERVKRNADLWWRGELGRPLIQLTVGGKDPGRPEPRLPARHFTAHYGLEANPDDIVDRWDYDLSRTIFLGDAFPSVLANFGPGIASAFLGARVECDASTVWFHPAEAVEAADLRFTRDESNPWLLQIKRIYEAGVARWQGSVQMSMTDLGGALDLLSVFRPGEQLLLDLILAPDAVKQRTWELHEYWFDFFETLNAVLHPVNPGYTCWAPIFSQTSYYMLQCDFCYMIGPHHFDEFVKPELAAACRRLDHPFYHLDGPGQLPHLDSLLEIEELAGVQWVPGAGARGTTKWPEVYRKIRGAGKLIQLLPDGDPVRTLDIVADQLGSADGIVIIGSVPPEQEQQAREALARYGAEE